MNIYLLKSRGGVVDYDTYDGHVVRAWSEHDARRAVPHGDECGFGRDQRANSDFWTNDATSSCERIGSSEPGHEDTEVILSSFNAG